MGLDQNGDSLKQYDYSYNSFKTQLGNMTTFCDTLWYNIRWQLENGWVEVKKYFPMRKWDDFPTLLCSFARGYTPEIWRIDIKNDRLWKMFLPNMAPFWVTIRMTLNIFSAQGSLYINLHLPLSSWVKRRSNLYMLMIMIEMTLWYQTWCFGK